MHDEHMISSEHLGMLQELARGRSILDIGDEGSPFLAQLFASISQKWTVVGRGLTYFIPDLSSHLVINNHKFTEWGHPPPPSGFDVILFVFSEIDDVEVEACLNWATPDQLIVFLCFIDGVVELDEDVFAHRYLSLTLLGCTEGLESRLLIFQKNEEVQKEFLEQQVDPFHRQFPRKGDRYHLTPHARWPGKKSGDRPPVVEIVRNWERGSGPVKIVSTEIVWYIRGADLGSAM
jgi:hypothetical protein